MYKYFVLAVERSPFGGGEWILQFLSNILIKGILVPTEAYIKRKEMGSSASSPDLAEKVVGARVPSSTLTQSAAGNPYGSVGQIESRRTA